MAKDPAYLFYSDNFLSGTMFFTDEQVGKYMRLLCAQHLTGHLLEKDMIKICKTKDEDIWQKFKVDNEGKFYNERLETEINKRKNFNQSRANNRLGKKKTNKNNKKKTSKSYDAHMGNGDGNENDIEIIYPFTSENFKKFWELWKTYKQKEFGFKYKSKISEQAGLKELSEISSGDEQIAIKIIHQSMAKKWQGLFELKNNGQTTTSNGQNGIDYDSVLATIYPR